MAKTREYAFVYLFGGIMYGLMEVIWRGHTHWTMTLTGGTALLILYIINIKMSNCNILLKCLIGASAITLLEFTVGVIINTCYDESISQQAKTKRAFWGNATIYSKKLITFAQQ